jgi:hypothetical protein
VASWKKMFETALTKEGVKELVPAT